TDESEGGPSDVFRRLQPPTGDGRSAPRHGGADFAPARKLMSMERFAKLLMPCRAAPPRPATVSVARLTVWETPCSACDTWSETFFFSQLPKLKRGPWPSLTSVLNVVTAFQRWLEPREAR